MHTNTYLGQRQKNWCFQESLRLFMNSSQIMRNRFCGLLGIPPLTTGGRTCKLLTKQNEINPKTMKRRVRRQIRHREPCLVERGAEGPGEHGLGVAWPTAPAA